MLQENDANDRVPDLPVVVGSSFDRPVETIFCFRRLLPDQSLDSDLVVDECRQAQPPLA